MNILSLFSSGALLRMLEMLLRIKARNFAAVVFVAGQFVHFRHTVDTRMSFCLPVIKAHFFSKGLPNTDN